MPVPTHFSACITESLKKSLSNSSKSHNGAGGKHVDQTVTSSAKRSLLEKSEIKFVKAERDANSMLEGLKNKYICLNRSQTNGINHPQVLTNGTTPGKPAQKDDGIPKPRVVLCSPDRLKLQWESPRRVGAGLANLGNTCFLNSVMQCLTYTAPLANHLLSGQHKSACRCGGFCVLCELQAHVTKCLSQSGGAVKPMGVLQKLKSIAKHMRWGRQEDAHEFLRYVVDGMQKSCLSGQNSSLEKLSKETTFVHQVFGGYLRSQVRCLQCKTTSNTYDPLLDISVDLKGTNSVEKALQKFVQPETLDIENAYKCARCKKKVRALKQFTIHRAPRVLTVHLKRFDYHRMMGGKVSRHIEFSQKLNIRQYMSQRQGEPVTYHLHAVLVHAGHSCNSGHYYCYIKAPNQTWYCMNDSHVSQTGLNSVLRSEAYILFYTQDPGVSQTSIPKSPSMTASNKHTNQTQKPTGNTQQPAPGLLLNGDSGKLKAATFQKKGPTILKTPTSSGSKSVPSTPRPTTIHTPGQSRRVSLTTLNDMISEDSGMTNGVSDSSPEFERKGVTPKTDNKPATIKLGGKLDVDKDKAVKQDKNNGAEVSKASIQNQDATSKKSKDTTVKPVVTVPSKADTPQKIQQSNDQSAKQASGTPTNGVKHVNGILSNSQKKKKHKLMDTENMLNGSSPSKKIRTAADFAKPLTVNTKTASVPTPKQTKKNKQISPGSMMSPPISRKENLTPKTSPDSCRATTPNWQVTPVNGRSHHPSESESISSINSTSDWKVSSTTKPSGTNNPTSNPVLTPQNANNADNQSSESKSRKKRNRKRRKRERDEADQKMDKEKLKNGDNVQRVNETTPSPTNDDSGSKDMTKKKKRKSMSNGDVVAASDESHKPDASENSSDVSQAAPVNGETSHMNGHENGFSKKQKKRKLKTVNDIDGADMHNGEADKSAQVSQKKKKKMGNGELSKSMIEMNGTAEDSHDDEAKLSKREKTLKKLKKRYSEPVVKQWDATIEDSDAVALQREDKKTPVSAWDGRKDSNISFILERHSTLKGLGPGVETWGGQKTEITRELDAAKFKSHYQNGWYNEYEQEIDQGKTKKVKVKKNKHKANQNHFQRIQNKTNITTQLKKEGKLPSLPDY